MDEREDDDPIEVTLSCSPVPRTVREFRLRLAPHATVADALEQACGPLRREFPQLDVACLVGGIDGRRVASSRPLEGGERIEWCRPLSVDPKRARRERFARQGSRASGLFAKRRAGAKPGY